MGAAVVLILAVTAGLLTAYVVANARAVPAPAAMASPTPSPVSAPPTSSPQLTEQPGTGTPQPRRTPTAPPTVTPEPTPFVHVVQAGESLIYIANLYGVTVDDIVALNDITNPNRIHVGQQLLIPGWAPTRP